MIIWIWIDKFFVFEVFPISLSPIKNKGLNGTVKIEHAALKIKDNLKLNPHSGAYSGICPGGGA